MGSSNGKEKNCIFCDYKNTQKKEKIVRDETNLVLFEDIKPMAKHHFLCIPKKHIKDINSLTKDDIPMLEEMKKLAINYLTETFGKEGVTEKDIIFGFHIPPFTSIPHLHMHCIVPPYNNYYYIVMNDYLILRTLDTVIANLKNKD